MTSQSFGSVGGYGVRLEFGPSVPYDGEPDPHQVLFVARNAPKEVVTAAWKALCKMYHPDLTLTPDQLAYRTRMTVRLNDAYDQLK